MTLTESIEKFLLNVAERLAQKTLKTYRDRLKGLVAMYGAEPVGNLRKKHVKKWLASLKGRDGKPCAPDSKRSAIVAATSWQKFALKKKHLTKCVFKKIRKPMGRKRERIPTDNEQAAILRLARKHCPAFGRIYRCLRYTGARPGELANAQIGEYDPSIQRITLKKHKTARKVGVDRKIGVGPRMQGIVKRSIGSRTTGHIFLNDRGRRWTAETLSHMFRKLREMAGLTSELVLYCTRHAAATAIYEKYGLPEVAKVLGHASWKTAEQYIKISDDKLIECQRAM